MRLATLSFAVFILMTGIMGVFSPGTLFFIADQFHASIAFYALGVIRILFGLSITLSSQKSRFPKTLRYVGIIILILGLITILSGFFATDRAISTIASWKQQGYTVARISSLFLVALGGFVTFALWPVRKVV